MAGTEQDDRNSISAFEAAVLSNLDKAGEAGRETAAFIREEGIRITTGRTWYPNWFSAWWDARRRTVVIDEDDFPKQRLDPGNPFLLNIIAHEVDHIRITLEHGRTLIPAGLTRYSEIRGWKTGYAVQQAFSRQTPRADSTAERFSRLDMTSADLLREGGRIIRAQQQRVRHGWVYSFLFSLLPARPWRRKSARRSIPAK